MRKANRIFPVLVSALAGTAALALPEVAFGAVDTGPICGTITSLVSGVQIIGVGAAALFAGVRAMQLFTAGGNPSAEADAKRGIVYAVAGAMILIGAIPILKAFLPAVSGGASGWASCL